MRFDVDRPIQILTPTLTKQHSMHSAGFSDPLSPHTSIHHDHNVSSRTLSLSTSSSSSSSSSCSQNMKRVYCCSEFGPSSTDMPGSFEMMPGPHSFPAKVLSPVPHCVSSFGDPTAVRMPLPTPPQTDSHTLHGRWQDYPSFTYRGNGSYPPPGTLAPPQQPSLQHTWASAPSSPSTTTTSVTSAVGPGYYSLPQTQYVAPPQPPNTCITMPQPINYQDMVSCNVTGAFEPSHWTAASYLSTPHGSCPSTQLSPTTATRRALDDASAIPESHRNKRVRPASPHSPHCTSPCDPSVDPDTKATPPPRRYKCKVCAKRFTRPSSLATHMHSHTGEKPYECTIQGCGRRFSVVSNLRRHSKIHLNNNNHNSSTSTTSPASGSP